LKEKSCYHIFEWYDKRYVYNISNSITVEDTVENEWKVREMHCICECLTMNL